MNSVNQIIISRDVTLQTLDEFLLPKIQSQLDQYQIDLSNASFISAPGSIIILLFIQHLKELGKKIIVIPPKKERVFRFLGNINFFSQAQNICDVDLLSLPQPVDHTQLAKWHILEIKPIPPNMTELGFRDWLSQSTMNTIIGKIDTLSSHRIENLPRVSRELSSNIFEHSQSSGYIAAQQVDNKLRLCIGDLGIGIYKSLLPFYQDDCIKFERRFGPVWDEPKALDLAFIPGVSSKLKNGEERGIGLTTVLSIAHQSKGAVICRSGKTKIFLGYKMGEWVTERKFNLENFPGTQLEIYL